MAAVARRAVELERERVDPRAGHGRPDADVSETRIEDLAARNAGVTEHVGQEQIGSRSFGEIIERLVVSGRVVAHLDESAAMSDSELP